MVTEIVADRCGALGDRVTHPAIISSIQESIAAPEPSAFGSVSGMTLAKRMSVC